MENEKNNEIEINEQTSFTKGIELEKEFAEYIRTELNYDKIKIRFQVKAKANSRGTNVDVIGQRVDSTGKTYRVIAFIYFLVFVIVYFYGIISYSNDSIDGGLLTLLFVISSFFLVGGLIFIINSEKNNIENIWTECKNLKTKVNINQIRKMLNEIKEYKESGDKQYKFVEFAFVSTSGFIDNAIELAIDNKINCYIKDGSKFKKVSKWN